MTARNATKNEQERKSYKSYVASRTRRNPCLGNLSKFLNNTSAAIAGRRNTCRIACLEFSSALSSPRRKDVNLSSLAPLLYNEIKGDEKIEGRLLIVEDLTRDVIEMLGSALNIDPFFFAGHIDVFVPEISTVRPYLATLPSRTSTQNFLTLHYHHVLELTHAGPARTLLQDMNVPRKVKLLPPSFNVSIGLARHCCSILKTVGRDGVWLGLVLVDPTSSKFYVSEDSRPQVDERAKPVPLQPRPFQGGFEDYRSPPAFDRDESSEHDLGRRSLFEDLVLHWTREQPSGFTVSDPTLVSLSYHPLRVIAAEWMTYLQVMYHSTKQYEFTPGTISAALQQIADLYTDLSALQKWARRSMATSYKLRYVISFLEVQAAKDQNPEYCNLLIQDFKHIKFNMDAYSRRLEAMVPILTSVIQIIDSQRSLMETANISRLTYLALVFIPLTFVTGLFSMNNDIAPGGKVFWLYFAVAIPLCIMVFLAARPPSIKNLGSLVARITKSRKKPDFKV